MILGRPWMMGQKATFSFDHRYLIFESGAYAPRTKVEKSIDLYQISGAAYSLWARDARKRRAQVFSASMTDIEKAL